MFKLKFILLLFIAISIDVYAQKLTPDEKIVFNEIVFKRRKAGEYETLSKWVVPIRYKIYGDTSLYLVKEVDSFFNQIRKLTELDIKKATSDTEENYQIVFGNNPEDFESYTLSKTPLTSPGSYRIKSTKLSEIYWGQNLINIKKFGNRANAKNFFRRNIIKTLGFLNNSKLAPNSVFTILNSNLVKLDEFDGHIISALYLQAIKPGMTPDEVDKILSP
ncbi:DUF2927 domain-containing protein [Pedobacter frigiditerrae]|uniref:DUF2927 domain-containing protein n=1 Tax=Pedobacter frigiditerrae TaxID=2530452 RepID=UPI0029308124|nr:DUF2927 domain-containing protein [Pedobacter frigiditerrae]